MGSCISRTYRASSCHRIPATNSTPAADGSPTGRKKRALPRFVPPVRGGRVIRVYDGDTITIASSVPGLSDRTVYQFSVRLNGIDTPEMKTNSEDEKQLATMARDALRAKILDQTVELRNVTTEKYGRLLAEVHHDGVHLNQWLIDQRYAVPYDGGTKQAPESWMQYHTIGN